MQDKLYVSTPGYGKVIVQRVPLTRVVPLEMIQYPHARDPASFKSPSQISGRGVLWDDPPLEQQEIRNAITGDVTVQGGRRT